MNAPSNGLTEAGGEPPAITVVIPTRDRPTDLARCLASVAKVRYPRWDLVLVDQSTGVEAARIAEAYRGSLPVFRYEHMDVANASAARNLGISLATGEIVAFLDDDCTVEPGWLAHVAAAFRRHPPPVLVCGSVWPAEHDPGSGFVPARQFAADDVLVQPLDMPRYEGMGASFYALRHWLERAGGFDLSLGPSARFRSGQDDDVAYRLLMDGGCILQTPSVRVVHHGSRPYAGGVASRHVRNYHFAKGALYMKMVRRRRPLALAVLLRKLGQRFADLHPLAPFTGGGPTNALALVAFVQGMWACFQAGIDHETGHFLLPAGERPGEHSTTPDPSPAGRAPGR